MQDHPNLKMLALTFDDGPNDSVMPQILELLKQYDARATFFVIGQYISEAAVPVLRQAAAQGCEIGNHSESHSHMSKLTRQQIAQETEAVQQRVEEILGIHPTLFRPPFLDVDEKMFETIRMPFIFGADTRDWDPECPVERRTELALGGAADGAIILMHCFNGNEATVEALRMILPELQRQGYQMVTVSELFAAKGITPKHGLIYEKAEVK